MQDSGGLVANARPTAARFRPLTRLGPWACAAVIVAATAWWVATSPTSILREQLRVRQFWILEILFVATAALTARGCRQLARTLTAHDFATMVGLAVSCAV